MSAQGATSEPMLAVRGVKTFYGSIMALKGVSLDVKQGVVVEQDMHDVGAVLGDLDLPVILRAVNLRDKHRLHRRTRRNFDHFDIRPVQPPDILH